MNWGTQYVVDGLIAMNTTNEFFLSKQENYPWFQLQLASEITINGINISMAVNYTHTGWEVEVRAGSTSVESGFNQKIDINTVCRKFVTHKSIQKYNIICNAPIISKFLTIQVIRKQSVLGMDEVETITDDIITECQFGSMYTHDYQIGHTYLVLFVQYCILYLSISYLKHGKYIFLSLF